MSSRDYIKHKVTNTSPNDAKVGDEYFDPATNRLYKTVANNGSQVVNTEVLLNKAVVSVNSITASANVTANALIFSDGTKQTSAGATIGDVLALSIALG
jgi:hypothetical protein